jgi:parallel beta-helix repeat protein
MSHENVYENNHAFSNGEDGMRIANSRLVTVRNNRSESNTGPGIFIVNGAARNTVEKTSFFKTGMESFFKRTQMQTLFS